MPPEAAAPATAASTSPSDADLVSDILSHQSTTEPAQAVDGGEDKPTEGDGANPEDDDSHDDEDSTEDDAEAEPSAAKGPLKAALAQVKKALEAGELDAKELGLTNTEWTAFRRAQAGERQKLAGERQQLSQWHQNAQAQLNQAIQQLSPMEPWYLAEQAFTRDGDPVHFVRVIEERTKLAYDEFQKMVLGRSKISPEVRRIRDEAERTKAELAELKAKLSQPQPVDPAAVRAQDMNYIRQTLTAPEDAKIPRFHDRVYAVLLKTANHLGATLTPEQAAERVRRGERKRIEASPHYKKPATIEEPAKKGKKVLLRKDSKSEAGKPAGPESDDDIVNDLLRGHKAAGAAVGR